MHLQCCTSPCFQLASTAIAIKTPEGVVLASERRLTSPLMVASGTEKIVEIDKHIGMFLLVFDVLGSSSASVYLLYIRSLVEPQSLIV